MAKRRRRKRRSASEGYLILFAIAIIAIGLIVSTLTWLASILWQPLLGIVVIAALAVCAALLFDAAAFASARVRGREPQGLRVTRHLVGVTREATRSVLGFMLRVLGLPVRLFREPRIRARTLGELLMLSPPQFEEAIAQSLRDRGCRRVKRRGGPGDLGVDITCLDPNGAKVAVQCKRYAPGKLVGSREVQLFIGMVTTEHRVDRGVLVTTSGFTAPAVALAKRHPWIRLIDGRELARIIGPEGPPLITVQPEPQPGRPAPTARGGG